MPRKIIWWVLEKKEISRNYIDVIKYMYDRILSKDNER